MVLTAVRISESVLLAMIACVILISLAPVSRGAVVSYFDDLDELYIKIRTMRVFVKNKNTFKSRYPVFNGLRGQ